MGQLVRSFLGFKTFRNKNENLIRVLHNGIPVPEMFANQAPLWPYGAVYIRIMSVLRSSVGANTDYGFSYDWSDIEDSLSAKPNSERPSGGEMLS
jgi:hypothetical protein